MADDILTIELEGEPEEPQNAVGTPDKLKETLDRYSGERKRLEQRVTSYSREVEKLKTHLREERETRQQLEEKLKDLMAAGMQYVRHELTGEPAPPQPEPEFKIQLQESPLEALNERQAAYQTELDEAERRVRDSVASLARATAELEKERANRRRIEERAGSLAMQVETMHGQLRQHLESERASEKQIAELETDLRDREATIAMLQADLQSATTDLRLANERLNTTAEISKQFDESLRTCEEAKQAFRRTEEHLKACLEASSFSLSEADARLQKETSERVRLAETVETLQRQLREETEKNKLEISQLQAALEMEKLERKQTEGNAVQARYASIESARADRVLLARLRTRTRVPMDEVLRSTRRLLENELDDERKKLVEWMLEQALLLKSNLHEVSEASETGQTPTQA